MLQGLKAEAPLHSETRRGRQLRLRFCCQPLAVGAIVALALFMATTGTAIPLIANSDATNTDTTSGAGLYVDPTNGLGSWIWASTVSDNQTVLLWKSFEIPASPRIFR